MSHASATERMKMSLKKAKESKVKKQAREGEKRAELGDEGYQEYLKHRNTKTIKQKAALGVWDYEQGQYPFTKRKILKEILEERMKEIKEEANENNDREENKIRRVLNELTQ